MPQAGSAAGGFRFVVAAGEYAFPSFRQRGQNCFGGKADAHESRTDFLAQILKAVLLRQENESISQLQDREGCSGAETKVFTELFRDSKLALLADLGGGQVLEGDLLCGHDGSPLVGISYHAQVLAAMGLLWWFRNGRAGYEIQWRLVPRENVRC
jgi:hypothetical protein